jgi:hypothetical protein
MCLHEIKHDGFRVIARKDDKRVRLYSRPGNDLTRRFPLIVDALSRLRSRSCIIDGEAVACDDNGVASFDLIRHYRANESIFLYAFDLIELNGDDLRRDPLEVRKATLATRLAQNEERECTGREARRRGRMGQKEMAITQGKMPFVFGMVVLATLLIAAPAAHAACRSSKNICKHLTTVCSEPPTLITRTLTA